MIEFNTIRGRKVLISPAEVSYVEEGENIRIPNTESWSDMTHIHMNDGQEITVAQNYSSIRDSILEAQEEQT